METILKEAPGGKSLFKTTAKILGELAKFASTELKEQATHTNEVVTDCGYDAIIGYESRAPVPWLDKMKVPRVEPVMSVVPGKGVDGCGEKKEQ